MKIEEILKKHNKSVTKERIEIYESFKEHHIFTSSQIIDEKIFSRASVFRTLNLFLEIWIIRKVNLWEKIETYELIDESHHHEHMKCEKCQKVISFESENICKKILEEASKKWFKVKSHNICVVWTCENCL